MNASKGSQKRLPGSSAEEYFAPSSLTLSRSPSADLEKLWNLGVAGVPLPQYLRWADEYDLIIAMADRESRSVEELTSATALSPRGVIALMGILCGLKLAHGHNGVYRLEDTAREYLDRRSTYYVGEALYGMLNAQLPKRLKKGARPRHFSRATGTLWYWIRYFRSTTKWGRPERLQIQHSRNFPAALIAARSEHFAGLKHLIDIGGGSGVFAIPLVLENPELRITLVELPNALPNVKRFLQKYRAQSRVILKGLNVHHTPWPLEDCDGILFANFMHFCSDEECLAMLQESHRLLPCGGRLLLHEMLWHDNKEGPLVTALWNFWITSISAGRQRTKAEFTELLIQSGFQVPVISETCGGFSLVVSTKS